jgi:starch phosphorylase
VWQGTQSIPAGALWRTHERRRERLVAFARKRLQVQLKNNGASQSAIDDVKDVLSPDMLTIGSLGVLLLTNGQRFCCAIRNASPAS